MNIHAISFKPTASHGNADAMSRLPLPDQPSSTPSPAEIVGLVEGLQEAPVTVTQIQSWTRQDPVLLKVWQLTKHSWSEKPPEDPPTETILVEMMRVVSARRLCALGFSCHCS